VEPKTVAGRRTLALPRRVVSALTEQLAAAAHLPANVNGLIFTTPKGTPLDPRNVSRAFGRDCEAVGLQGMHLHQLRHFYASQMLASGATLYDVMRALGHSSISTTIDTYGHLVEGRSRELADVMDRLLG
jgi:integrase